MGRAFDERSHAYVHIDFARTFRIAGDGVFEGEKRHPHSSNLWGKRRNFVGQHFWTRGFLVSPVGQNETAVKKYIQGQEKEDQRREQMGLFNDQKPL
jgi:REP element-mobilizing transposase RayT